jgi:hypothetical protein
LIKLNSKDVGDTPFFKKTHLNSVCDEIYENMFLSLTRADTQVCPYKYFPLDALFLLNGFLTFAGCALEIIRATGGKYTLRAPDLALIQMVYYFAGVCISLRSCVLLSETQCKQPLPA